MKIFKNWSFNIYIKIKFFFNKSLSVLKREREDKLIHV